MRVFTHEEAKILREQDCFDTRNIRDMFKGMEHEEIVSSLPHNNLVAVCSNRIRDFNWGSVVRNANAFGVNKVIFTGKKRYDRRSTVGAHKYTNIEYLEDIFEVIDNYRQLGYRIAAAEYDENYPMVSLYDYQWEEKTVVLFGEEGVSLEPEVLAQCDDIVAIPMFGVVRSINVSAAAGIILSHYASQHPPTQR